MTAQSKTLKNTVVFNSLLLLGANALTIYLFIVQNASIWQVLLTYYAQTVVISMFYYSRILTVNITEADSDNGQRNPLQKAIIAYRATQREQFQFLFIFGAPLAFVLYVILINLTGSAISGSLPILSSSINYWSVGIGVSAFLLHHAFSFGLTYWEYRKGVTDRLSIPYAKLTVRVFTILALIFFTPLLFTYNSSLVLFYIFMAVKSMLDILLSSSFVLMKDLWIGRSTY